MQILFYDQLFDLIGILQNSLSFLSHRNDRFANLIVFTIEGYGAVERNSGFMWEPKGFANILILAIIFNLIKNRLQVANKRNLVYILALITTFSTTGYLIIFGIIPAFILLNKKLTTKVLSSIILIVGVFYISQLDFMLEKIKYESTLTGEYKKLLETDREYDRASISLGRVGSFIVDFNDFKKKPLFGYGYQKEERTQNRWIKLVRVNGFSDLMATYGLFGLLFYLFRYYRFTKKLLNYYKIKGGFLILIGIGVIYFASTLTTHPLWMSFLFIDLIIPKKEYENTIYRTSRFKKRPQTLQAN